MSLADLVSAERQRRGWTKTELASRARVHPSVVSRIESGERLGRTDTVARVTAALGLDPAAIEKLMLGQTVVVREERTPYEVLQELQATLRNQDRRLCHIVALAVEEQLEAERADPGSYVNTLLAAFGAEYAPEAMAKLAPELWAKRQEQLRAEILRRVQERLDALAHNHS